MRRSGVAARPCAALGILSGRGRLRCDQNELGYEQQLEESIEFVEHNVVPDRVKLSSARKTVVIDGVKSHRSAEKEDVTAVSECFRLFRWAFFRAHPSGQAVSLGYGKSPHH